jgi:hypothetical protein
LEELPLVRVKPTELGDRTTVSESICAAARTAPPSRRHATTAPFRATRPKDQFEVTNRTFIDGSARAVTTVPV